MDSIDRLTDRLTAGQPSVGLSGDNGWYYLNSWITQAKNSHGALAVFGLNYESFYRLPISMQHIVVIFNQMTSLVTVVSSNVSV